MPSRSRPARPGLMRCSESGRGAPEGAVPTEPACATAAEPGEAGDSPLAAVKGGVPGSEAVRVVVGESQPARPDRSRAITGKAAGNTRSSIAGLYAGYGADVENPGPAAGVW